MSAADELLARVRDASAEADDAARALSEARAAAQARRAEAIRAAMAAGIPRAIVAEAAGVHRSRIYRLAEK